MIFRSAPIDTQGSWGCYFTCSIYDGGFRFPIQMFSNNSNDTKFENKGKYRIDYGKEFIEFVLSISRMKWIPWNYPMLRDDDRHYCMHAHLGSVLSSTIQNIMISMFRFHRSCVWFDFALPSLQSHAPPPPPSSYLTLPLPHSHPNTLFGFRWRYYMWRNDVHAFAHSSTNLYI